MPGSSLSPRLSPTTPSVVEFPPTLQDPTTRLTAPPSSVLASASGPSQNTHFSEASSQLFLPVSAGYLCACLVSSLLAGKFLKGRNYLLYLCLPGCSQKVLEQRRGGINIYLSKIFIEWPLQALASYQALGLPVKGSVPALSRAPSGRRQTSKPASAVQTKKKKSTKV